MTADTELDRGRRSYEARVWSDAYEALAAADRSESLAAADLDLLATTAYMLGCEDEYFAALERSHHAHLEAGNPLPAVRSAFWIGANLALKGETGSASGWLSRARRLVEREEDCVEHGYLLLPKAFEQEARGDWAAAAETADRAVEIAERFDDRDLLALAVHEQGHVLIVHGQVADGLRLLDEAMVAVTTGELSPIVSGIVYCGVILACQEAYEPGRAREWTAALTAWCAAQPDMVAFTGRCLLHRAEILQLGGEWGEALEESRRAAERSERGGNLPAAGEARYREGELLRMRGELAEAERCYREASRLGREPQPGLALLCLAQGDADAAAAAIRRATAEASTPAARGALFPARVEIMLAIGEGEEARAALEELERLAESQEGPLLAAMASSARGALEMAEGDAGAALTALRRAVWAWQELEAPYEAARARLDVGLACRALSDEDAAARELAAAREAFERLGALPDLERAAALARNAAADNTQGLSDRELEVLRHLAAGDTNKAIAAELVLSVRTVDRHVSNIFAKLGVSSRAEAASYAHRHDLL